MHIRPLTKECQVRTPYTTQQPQAIKYTRQPHSAQKSTTKLFHLLFEPINISKNRFSLRIFIRTFSTTFLFRHRKSTEKPFEKQCLVFIYRHLNLIISVLYFLKNVLENRLS